MDANLPGPSKRGAATFARVLILLSSLVISLVVAEAGLRLSGRVRIPPQSVVTSRPELFHAHHPYGYRLWPSRTMTYLYPRQNPRRLTLVSNRHGFRNRREFEEQDARPRVVVLGDSMTLGEGVEEDERFSDQLEQMQPAWRVDNLGMTGFGPDLMLRAFEEVGRALKPRVVVVAMYTDDFRRVRPEYAGAGFKTLRFALQSGNLVSIEYPRARGWMRWSTVAALRELAWRLSGTELALNEAILDRFRDHAARTPFKLALFFLPGTSDTPKDQSRRAWLREYARRTGVPFLDLTDSILRPGSASLFIPNNPHLNRQGHAVVARELQRWIAAEVLGSSRLLKKPAT